MTAEPPDLRQPDLRQALQCVRDAQAAAVATRMPEFARHPTDEAAALIATVLAAAPDERAAAIWSTLTGSPQRQFAAASALGQSWQSAPSPVLASLLAGDAKQAETYARALAELAAVVAGLEPLDLRRVNAAAFIAAAQLRALAPEHGHLLPRSVTPIVQGLRAIQPAPDRNVAKAVEPETAARESSDLPVPADTAPGPLAPETYAELLDQLDDLVGLEPVKTDVRRQAELLRVARIRGERGMKNPEITRHLVFTGNPGTGKTTVARLVAKIYRSLGLLEKGHLVELDRTGLVGGYLGQSETKTAEAVQRALGGVLFIDEAYALAGDQYGDAAVAVLVKAMEDHRDDLVVIAAGYTDSMTEFLEMNPGLSSRLRLTICFPDYSDDELVEIFTRLARQSDYVPSGDCVAAVRELVAAQPRDESFGNARFVRQCFEAALVRQAWRLREVETPTDEQLRALTASDVAVPPPPEARADGQTPADSL